MERVSLSCLHIQSATSDADARNHTPVASLWILRKKMENSKSACFCYWWNCWRTFKMEMSDTEFLCLATDSSLFTGIWHSDGKDAESSNTSFSLCAQMSQSAWCNRFIGHADCPRLQHTTNQSGASQHKSKRSKPQCSCEIVAAAWIAAKKGDISENEYSVQPSTASSAERLTANRSCGLWEPTSFGPTLPATPNRLRGLWLLRERCIAQGVTGGECKTECESRRPGEARRISQLAIRSLTIPPSTEDWCKKNRRPP